MRRKKPHEKDPDNDYLSRRKEDGMTMNIIQEDYFPPIHYIREDLHTKRRGASTLKAIRHTAVQSAINVSCFLSAKEWKDMDDVSLQCRNTIEDYTDTVREDGSRVLAATLRHCRIMYSTATNHVTIFFAPHVVEKLQLKETTKQKLNGHWVSPEVLLAFDERLDYACRWMEMTEKWEASDMGSELAVLEEMSRKLDGYSDVFDYEMDVHDTYVSLELLRKGAHYSEEGMDARINNATWQNDLKQTLSRFFISTLKMTRKEIAEKESYCVRITEASRTL